MKPMKDIKQIKQMRPMKTVNRSSCSPEVIFVS